MALRREQLNLLYARRREQEHNRIERTEALQRYYDHWGKVTSKYENLAGPEYYKGAEEKFNKLKAQKNNQTQLAIRREKLQNLLKEEKVNYEKELENRQRPRSRKLPESIEDLEKIKLNAQKRENVRRKLELEAKLYGKWRNGVDDENSIFESRSNHEVLAKLNWLDRQIAEKEQKEKEEAEAAQRELEMQKELTKMAEIQKEREEMRDKELKEIREYQEEHIKQIEELKAQHEKLTNEEKHCRDAITELESERELLQESAQLILMQPEDSPRGYNLNKVKVLLRKRSEMVREVIKICCSILERMSNYTMQKERLDKLKKDYEEQLESEGLMLPLIEAMYESEAKFNLKKAEETWSMQHNTRMQQISALIEDEVKLLNTCINGNLQQQDDIVQLRTAHLNAIEIANDNLKKLMKEQEDDNMCNMSSMSVPVAVALARNNEKSSQVKNDRLSSKVSESYLPKVTNSFTNLNLDVWKDIADSPPNKRIGKSKAKSPSDTENLQPCVVTNENAERPKFARKRIAWT